MIKTTVLTAALMLATLSSTAFASYAPITYTQDRTEVAARCTALGAAGRGHGLTASSGPYGCRNIETGGAIQCDAGGTCRDYSGDFRWKRIQTILNDGTPLRHMRLPGRRAAEAITPVLAMRAPPQQPARRAGRPAAESGVIACTSLS